MRSTSIFVGSGPLTLGPPQPAMRLAPHFVRAAQRAAVTSIFLLLACPTARAQTVLYTFDGDSPGDLFGFAVSGAGDVNGDGHADLIVGVHRDENNGAASGSARVFSGLDGSVLYNFDGDSQNDVFGYSVSGAGDVNGDGFDDLLVGAFGDDNNNNHNSGTARVFSGADGSTLYDFDGDAGGDAFGFSVSGAGDVNGDGFADLIVGARQWAVPMPGYARVFSGVDGSTLYTFQGDSVSDEFGISVSGAGDVNGDGFDDLVVGAWGDDNNGNNSGSARIFSGVDGSVLYTLHGDSSDDQFGGCVSGAGDVNGDGFDDLIVGANQDDNNGLDSGSARVFSGLDGSLLYAFNGDSAGDQFGISVSSAGDVDGDGFGDVLVGAYLDDNNGLDSGSARVFSGLDGSTLYTLDGDSPDDHLGYSVSGAGDVTGDGFGAVFVGIPLDDNNGLESGSARVFSGCDACGTSIGTNYCGPANLNSTLQSAVISGFGATQASLNFVTLTASLLPPNVFGYFLNSDVQAFTPFPPGSNGNLCLGGSIGRHAKQIANSGAAGELVLDLDLTLLPRPGGTHAVVAGETWNFQCWFRDKQPGPTSNFTDGLSITFL